MDKSMKTDVASDALKMAIRSRRPQPGKIYYSDWGVQYASYKYQNKLNSVKMRCIINRKDNC